MPPWPPARIGLGAPPGGASPETLRPCLRALALHLRADCSPRKLGRGSAELAAWLEDLHALAPPLFELGLPVPPRHCFPIYWRWQQVRLSALSDLREPVHRSVFLGLSSLARALAASGVATAGFGAHSFRRGRATELLHGGSSRQAGTEVLRHRSVSATGPYIADSVRLVSLAASMTAATSGRRLAERDAATPRRTAGRPRPSLPGRVPAGGRPPGGAGGAGGTPQRPAPPAASVRCAGCGATKRGKCRGDSCSRTWRPGAGPWPPTERGSGPCWTRRRAPGPWARGLPRSSCSVLPSRDQGVLDLLCWGFRRLPGWPPLLPRGAPSPHRGPAPR